MPASNLSILFADDVREEEGNKLSIMGVFGAKVLLPELPTMIPRICLVMLANVVEDEEINLRCKITSDAPIPLPGEFTRLANAEAGQGAWAIRIVLALQGIHIPHPCHLDVEFEVGDQLTTARLLIDTGVSEPGKVESEVGKLQVPGAKPAP